MQLDRFDIEILNRLQEDGRMSWTALSDAVNLSASAVQRRVQSLQQSGVIRHFTLVLDNALMGREVRAFVQVKIARSDSRMSEQFRSVVLDYDEIQACHKVSGSTDFILNVVAENLSSFSRFLEDKILYLPSVSDAISAIVLETVKESGVAVRS